MVINTGDIVWLKSGGPAMTTQQQNRATGVWTCSWFSGKKLESANFSPSALTTTEPDHQSKPQEVAQNVIILPAKAEIPEEE